VLVLRQLLLLTGPPLLRQTLGQLLPPLPPQLPTLRQLPAS